MKIWGSLMKRLGSPIKNLGVSNERGSPIVPNDDDFIPDPEFYLAWFTSLHIIQHFIIKKLDPLLKKSLILFGKEFNSKQSLIISVKNVNCLWHTIT